MSFEAGVQKQDTSRHRYLSRRLLAWYDRNARELVWRALPGEPIDPYRVWLSEIMLQQTTVEAVGGHFARFSKRWPNLESLAAADLESVLDAWAGLGYYSRARNLHACARRLVRDHQGMFARHPADLQKLPGIGPYTAAAIAAIAFDGKCLPVDANIERVLARLFCVDTPLPKGKKVLQSLANTFVLPKRNGDLAQAFMDLGALICTVRKPQCTRCPLKEGCKAFAQGTAEVYPKKAVKAEKPLRYGTVFWIENSQGAVLLRRRPLKGLLAGMLEVPGTTWVDAPQEAGFIRSQSPVAGEWQILPGLVTHSFTHFHLSLAVWRRSLPFTGDSDAPGIWVHPYAGGGAGLPTLMKKVVTHALHHPGGSRDTLV